jgi:mono/diheme cytochrome c family protein
MRLVPSVTAVFALAAGAALAQEPPIDLKNGAGRDVVEDNCATCHSLDYIEMNSPFPDAKLWTAEVDKMIKTYGAPIAPDDAKIIIEYLVANYGTHASAGPPPSGPAAATPTETGTPGSATRIDRQVPREESR